MADKPFPDSMSELNIIYKILKMYAIKKMFEAIFETTVLQFWKTNLDK